MANDYFTGGSVAWDKARKAWRGTLSYYEDGKRKQKAKLFRDAGKSKKAAQSLCDEWKAELNAQARITNPAALTKSKSAKTVGERLREYLDYLKDEVALGHMEQSTLTAKIQCSNLYIYPYPIAGIPYERLSKDEILEWERTLHEDKHIANSTIGIPHSLLRRIYNYDIEQGTIKDTPFRFIRAPKANKRNVNYAKDETLRRLTDTLDIRFTSSKGSDADCMAYILALYTGMRGEEICGLQWKDVHFAVSMLEVKQVIARNADTPYVKPPKNATSERTIPIMDRLKKYLEMRYRYVCFAENVEEPHGNWFVVGDRDKFKNPQNVTGNFGRFCRRNEIIGSEGEYLTLHGLRHTLATIGVQSKSMDIKTLASILGHSNVAMTLNTYAGFGDNEARIAGMNAISSAFDRAIESDD